LVEKARSISQYLTRFLYNTRSPYVMARTTQDYGSNRFVLTEDFQLISVVKGKVDID
jgi:hypothetical protein